MKRLYFVLGVALLFASIGCQNSSQAVPPTAAETEQQLKEMDLLETEMREGGPTEAGPDGAPAPGPPGGVPEPVDMKNPPEDVTIPEANPPK